MSLTQINKAGLDEIALDHVFTIGASGSSAYTFQGEGLNGTVNNPTLYLTRGKTYRFENGSGGHPIRIQSTSGASGTAYNTGVTNNAGSGTVIVEVQHDAPDVLYYQCTSHANMNGILYITGALSDGGVTTAKIADSGVTTAKIADDAVTADKLANSINTSISDKLPLAGGTLTGNLTLSSTHPKLSFTDTNHDSDFQIMNNHGNLLIYDQTNATSPFNIDSSGNIQVSGTVDGVDIAALNSTVSGLSSITVGNAADERVVTSDGTNLDAESLFVYKASNNTVGIGTSTPEPTASYYQGACLHIHQAASGGSVGAQVHLSNDYGGSGEGDGSQVSHYNHHLYINNQENGDTYFYNNGSSNLTIKADGKVGVGTQSPSQELHVNGDIQASSIFLGGTGSANQLDDYEEGTFTPTISQGITSPTLAEAEGTYTKIGNVVKFNFFIRVASGGGSSNGSQFKFSGLPFTQDNTSGRRGFGVLSYSNAHGMNYETGHHLYIYGGVAELFAGLHAVTAPSTSNQQYRYFIGGGHYYV